MMLRELLTTAPNPLASNPAATILSRPTLRAEPRYEKPSMRHRLAQLGQFIGIVAPTTAPTAPY